jgi:mannose-6-phosphate isomerase-like protein (cupin superfamily)
MNTKSILTSLLIFAVIAGMFAPAAAAQTQEVYQIDPTPYDPAKDLDTNMFMAHWNESVPRAEHGNMIVRDVFTPNTSGDVFRPTTRGEVLKVLVNTSYGMLDVGLTTLPDKLDGVQKIFYTLTGTGTVTAGGITESLSKGVAVLMPEGLEFTISNTGDVPLTFYIPTEPVIGDFTPRKDMLVKDSNLGSYSGIKGHWTNMGRGVFGRKDGLCCITASTSVFLAPMQFAQPHAAITEYIDVVWFAISGDTKTLLGKQLRDLPPGTGFVNPGDGRYYHSNINTSEDEYINLLWLRAQNPLETRKDNPSDDIRKYYRLDPIPYDPAVDLAPRDFISHWKEGVPHVEHGNIIVRDIFTRNKNTDKNKPSGRGEVLRQLVSVSHGILDKGLTTKPEKLDGIQKIFYILDGTAVITGGKKTAELKPGMAALIPPNLEFSISNTGEKPLKMYIPCEPIPDGFKPRRDMLVRDENIQSFNPRPSHWSNWDSRIFSKDDGLAYLMGMMAVRVAPMSVPEMHPANAPDNDIVWYAAAGDPYSMLGKQFFHLEPGSAFMNPGDNRFNHGNVNISEDTFIKMIWLRTQTPK